ncbi:MAG: hypothetical protein HYY18_22235 [Planctomycetes bacterium]|nr:hypothetical protein [Planctomycetota bacterium]
MSPIQKGIIWMACIIVAIFAISIGLSWYSFGYLDWSTVGSMGLLLLPILGAASVAFVWTARVETSRSPREVAAPAATPVESPRSQSTAFNPAHSGI